tara:strand:+ start:178 stop:1173 length:996 start_codon:yes stop_codon:yes gene_type:complete
MKKVFVTGGNSYLGLHCISELIKANYFVKVGIRDKSKEIQIKKSISESVGSIKNLQLCLLDFYDEADCIKKFSNCDYLIHLASPNPFEFKKDFDLIQHTVDLTSRTIRYAVHAKVKKFVLMSSQASMTYGDHEKYNENSWTDASDLNLNPYIRSKTVAEREAWNLIRNKYFGKMNFWTLNPGFIIGPIVGSHSKGVSVDKIKNILNKKTLAVPNRYINCIDVRDLAKICVASLSNEKVSGHRFPCMLSEPISFHEICLILKKRGYNVTTLVIPDIAIKILGLFSKKIKYISYLANKKRKINNSLTTKILNWKPTAIEHSILDMASSLENIE